MKVSNRSWAKYADAMKKQGNKPKETPEYVPYLGEVPYPDVHHPLRRRCMAHFSGCWRCELIEGHVGGHVSKAFEEAGRPFQDRQTGDWLVEKREE